MRERTRERESERETEQGRKKLESAIQAELEWAELKEDPAAEACRTLLSRLDDEEEKEQEEERKDDTRLNH